MSHLLLSDISQEGLFRKSGQLNRQKSLREKLEAGEDVTLDLDEGVFSAHDAATLLKSYFAELPEPILQERYYPAYCQVLGEFNVGGFPVSLEIKSNQCNDKNVYIRGLSTLYQSVEDGWRSDIGNYFSWVDTFWCKIKKKMVIFIMLGHVTFHNINPKKNSW